MPQDIYHKMGTKSTYSVVFVNQNEMLTFALLIKVKTMRAFNNTHIHQNSTSFFMMAIFCCCCPRNLRMRMCIS